MFHGWTQLSTTRKMNRIVSDIYTLSKVGLEKNMIRATLINMEKPERGHQNKNEYIQCMLKPKIYIFCVNK